MAGRGAAQLKIYGIKETRAAVAAVQGSAADLRKPFAIAGKEIKDRGLAIISSQTANSKGVIAKNTRYNTRNQGVSITFGRKAQGAGIHASFLHYGSSVTHPRAVAFGDDAREDVVRTKNLDRRIGMQINFAARAAGIGGPGTGVIF